MNLAHTLLAAAALLCTASAAFAQATIDQSKALAGGITRDDTPGFPITLNQAGHYKLMGNLVVPSGVNAIDIAADDVTLDLNGFRILGAGSCVRNTSNFGVVCSGHGGAIGINVQGDFTYTSIIRNGTVRGFGTGVAMAGGLAEDLIVKFNDKGLHLRALEHVPVRASGITAFMNTYGIRMEAAGLVERSVAAGNNFGVASIDTFQVGTAKDVVAHMNQIGVARLGINDVRATTNKTDLSQTVGY